MKRRFITALAAAGLVLLLPLNAAWALELITRDVVDQKIITEVDLIRTADNFVILFDGSSSANQKVPGTDTTKIVAAKALLRQRNQWLPDLGYTAGLYLLSGWTSFKTIYAAQRYDREAFARAIDQLPDEGKGNSLLQLALFELEKVLSTLSGSTAVILFTDGTYTKVSHPKKPIEIAKEIAQKHDVRFYVISSADKRTEKEMLKRVASVNSGSQVIPIEAFLRQPEYLSGALFTVKASSYVKLTPTKEVIGFKTNDMLFDSNSHAIRAEYKQKLDMLGRFLQENPQSYVVLQGHSDGTGSKDSNLRLSQARAMSVSDYLSKNFNIDPERIVPLWYGDLNLAADNGSPEGRRLNRRVEIAVGVL